MIYHRIMSAAVEDPPSGRRRTVDVYGVLRDGILRGEFAPGSALKPQTLATSMGVSLSVVRESLQQLMGEGLAERHPNRGFFVPPFSDARWQQIAEARQTIEPVVIRMSIERGDLEWETRVRAAHHRLERTAVHADPRSHRVSDEWSAAHYEFHRALLDGCGNPMLLDTFDRLWMVSQLARQWAGPRDPSRDFVAEHRELERAAIARDADAAAALLERHVALTAAALRDQDATGRREGAESRSR